MIAAGIVAVSILPGTTAASADPTRSDEIGRVSVPRADCGPGSHPETGLQGDVPAEDRDSGRSREGYRCNTTLVGQHAGNGGGITSTTFEHCSYTGTFFPGDLVKDGGVEVIDASDPANPVVSTVLTEPAMRGGTWETLKVNKERKLLAAASVPSVVGGGYFSVYDISDCAHPRLLNPGPGTTLSKPLPFTAHEGGFSPDGNTYWASGFLPGFLSAIDISDPANPNVVWQGLTGIESHGFGISPDGNRMYVSTLTGVSVLDTSSVQRRDSHPLVPQVGGLAWDDGQFTQHSIPVTYDGKPFIFTADEAGSGGVKLIDVSDEANLKIVERVKLEINLPQNLAANYRSAQGGSIFAYDSHYCAADRPVNPTALACGWVSSGVRVFDVKDPNNIREIAYYNPPARTGEHLQVTNSPHALASITGIPALSLLSLGRAVRNDNQKLSDAISPRSLQVAFGDLSSDWCFSPPEWRGTQLWTTCSDNGFMVIQLDNNVYSPPPNQNSTVGS